MAEDAKESPALRRHRRRGRILPWGGGEACRPPIPDFRPPELETVRFCGCNHLVCRTLFWQHQDTKALSVEATGAPGGSPGWSRSFEDP